MFCKNNTSQHVRERSGIEETSTHHLIRVGRSDLLIKWSETDRDSMHSTLVDHDCACLDDGAPQSGLVFTREALLQVA